MSEPTLAASTRMSPRLAARHAARGRGALVETLVCHRAMLVKVAQGVTGCASRAEDVVHDVLLRLVDFPNQEAIRQPLAYVTRMVRNASIDVCRRQSLETHWHAEAEAGLDVPSPEPTPEAIALTRDALERMRAALTEVPVRSRTAFEMVRVREETLAAAADALDVSPTLVHFMVRDVVRHCAECLAALDRGVAPPAFAAASRRR
ncbi:RNA polymerase factor sigma-70 [Burkholderia gladioli]|uniref:RNA polymerase factor sigma-70 n=1 Tax=Burkholderia gladioli TaxID=28095 RepID=UPI000CFE9708|nr:RNA polymerase factor sigma-70 [Burkholderia gladioli]MBU9270301.1 RNA polymerase factor sigma-70 [Burkholderia gladioli]MBU9273075.1 RNA polymerase factor sigma-70 [Burkholderia gladioli]MBU9687034.1 RNA polymerase factor sigma-70 [Burkholderia gladioli]NRF85361.1 RNA polymerase factor sigma-70 [Burkholderia gladioli]